MYFSYSSERYKHKIKRAIDLIESLVLNELKEIWIFGSLARGEGRCTSDIDLMLNFKTEYPSKELRLRIYNILDEVGTVGEDIDVKFCVDGIIDSYSKFFIREVLKDKVILRTYVDGGCHL